MAGNANTVYRFLRGKGLSPAQAAGVVGGLSGESGPGLSTTARNPSSGAYGIGQWLGGRKSALMARPNPTSLGTQLNYLWSELQGSERGAYQQLRAARTPAQATEAWVRGFERPSAGEIASSLGGRQATAAQVYRQFKGQGGIDVGGGDTGGGGSVPFTTTTSTPGELPGGGQQGLQLLQALQKAQETQQPASAGVASPSFAAAPVTPESYKAVQTGTWQPESKIDTGTLLAALKSDTSTPAQGTTTQTTTNIPTAGTSSGGTTDGGGTVLDGTGGSVRVAAGANRSGVGLSPGLLKVVRAVSARAGQPLTIGTGTNHSRMTVDGNVSDHWGGNAADIPAAGGQLIRIGQDALIAAGMSPKRARQQRGGLYNIPYGKGRRIQVIFNTQQGGDHTDHLHVGVTAM